MASFSTILLPETLNRQLPENIADAHRLNSIRFVLFIFYFLFLEMICFDSNIQKYSHNHKGKTLEDNKNIVVQEESLLELKAFGSQIL